jgi:hypothetical protein
MTVRCDGCDRGCAATPTSGRVDTTTGPQGSALGNFDLVTGSSVRRDLNLGHYTAVVASCITVERSGANRQATGDRIIRHIRRPAVRRTSDDVPPTSCGGSPATTPKTAPVAQTSAAGPDHSAS